MHDSHKEKLLSLLKKLVNCQSITGTTGEIEMEKILCSILSRMDYFKSNPQHLILHPVTNDPHGRSIVAALLKGKGRNTVILLGHHDVVDTVDYGPYKEYAFSPQELAAKLDPEILSPEAREDLKSGKWLFGRGVMDMKAGISLFLYLLDKMGRSIENMDGNILFLSVPDEETCSAGMLEAVPFLTRLSDQEKLDYLCVINSEPSCFNVDGTYNLYTGSIGKLLPVIFCFGKETHVREPFEGLNSNLLMAELLRIIEGNSRLSDSVDEMCTMPPTSLKAKDLKEAYSVSVPAVSICYFNMFTYRRSPKELLDILIPLCKEAFYNALKLANEKLHQYNRLSGSSISRLPWSPKVLTFQELYEICSVKYGEPFHRHMKGFIEREKHNTGDDRELAIKVVTEVHNWCPDRDPKIVIAFAPPYYPHITIRGETRKEIEVLGVVENLKDYSRKELGVDLYIQKYFNGISDLSYCALQDAEDVINSFKPNMPAWGYSYSLPLEEMRHLNVPAIILGPWGKDAHKFTERLNLDFFLNKSPYLLEYMVKGLLRTER